MERQCNLELRLSLASSGNDGNGGGDHKPLCLSRPSANQQQCMTILHSGQISVCDVTELQARTVIWWAGQFQRSRENTNCGEESYEEMRLQFLVQSVIRGLLMKKSLQRFLQRRNIRIRSVSPYFRR